MVMTDPIADMIARIKNALMVKRPHVDVPHSKIKERIADILSKEGFIKGYEVLGDGVKKTIRIYLKYNRWGEPVIKEIKRVSKPGRRIYVDKGNLPRVLSGLGIAILTTSKGVITDREARKLGVGGEVICYVW